MFGRWAAGHGRVRANGVHYINPACPPVSVPICHTPYMTLSLPACRPLSVPLPSGRVPKSGQAAYGFCPHKQRNAPNHAPAWYARLFTTFRAPFMPS